MLRLALNERTTTTAEIDTTANPKYYVWWFPGSPVKVHLALPVVQRLADSLQNQGTLSTRQGVLLGKFLDGAIEIQDFRPTGGNLTELLAAGSDTKNELAPVGYYRTDSGDTLRLNENDRMLAGTIFVKQNHVFLIIQTTGFGPPNATFFFRETDGALVEFPFLEFPFDPAQLAVEEHDRMQRAHSAILASPVEPKLPTTAEHKSSPFKVARGIKVTAGILAVAGILICGIWLIRDGLNDQLHRLWNNASHPSAGTPTPRGPLGLAVLRQNTDIRVTWNHKADAITGAVSGVLSIDDGGTIRKINLDSQEIRDGSIIYSPTGTQIRLQLTIFGSHESASESAIIVSSKTPEPQPTGLPNVVSPTAPAAASGSPTGLAAPVYQPPTIVRSATAVYPSDLLDQALADKIVKIKVSLNELGQILKAEPLPSTDSIPQSMIGAALQAAQLSQFRPAHRGPIPMPGNVVLQFAFKRLQ